MCVCGPDFAYIVGNKDIDTGIYPTWWNYQKCAHYESKILLKQDVISSRGKKYNGNLYLLIINNNCMNAVKEHLTFENIYALGRLQNHLRHKGI